MRSASANTDPLGEEDPGLPEHYDWALIEQVVGAFGLERAQLVALQPPGSPNRSIYRCVVESRGGAFILEQVAAESVPRKSEIAATLARLNAAGLSTALAYRPALDGEPVAHVAQTWWLAAAFVPSDPLPRPDWAHDAARGEALAGWLLLLREVTVGWRWSGSSVFRLELWLPTLVTLMRRRDPDVLARVRAPLRLAQQALLGEPALPVAWAHGDFHPLNVLGHGTAVQTVIDGEFTGPKVALYDLANLIGCAGVEDPQRSPASWCWRWCGICAHAAICPRRAGARCPPMCWRCGLPGCQSGCARATARWWPWAITSTCCWHGKRSWRAPGRAEGASRHEMARYARAQRGHQTRCEPTHAYAQRRASSAKAMISSGSASKSGQRVRG